MAKAHYDPKASTLASVLYCTATSTDPGFIRAYPSGQTLTEMSPKGAVCKPGTLEVAPTTW